MKMGHSSPKTGHSRSRPRGTALAAALLAGAVACSEEAAVDGRPPLVLITLDTTRVDHLSCYGYGQPTTPHLERLAAESVVFTDCIAVSSWTLPTHASMFTGLFPSTHGAHYDPEGEVALSTAVGGPEIFAHFKVHGLAPEAVTLAEVLQSAGYATVGVGSGPWLKPVFGLAQGFHAYDCEFSSIAGRAAPEVNAIALPFLRRQHRRPFFLFLNYFDPHDPYDPPPELARRFLAGGAPSDARLAALARYDAELFEMDAGIGEVLDELRARGLYDRSWIVVVSDHGELFGEHGLEMHGFSLFEDEVRSALMIKPPVGRELILDPAARVQHVDLMPFLLHELGIPAPPMEGDPLGRVDHAVVSELFENEGNVVWKGERFRRRLWAIYSGRFKRILSTKENDPDAGLFDLEVDPGERHDLAADRPEEARKLAAEWSAWRDSLLEPLDTSPLEGIDEATQRQLRNLGYAGPGK
ncbi:MAG: sulfatase [Planctomycetota bacterium]